MDSQGIVLRQATKDDRAHFEAFLAASPDAPRWPSEAWEPYLSNAGSEAPARRLLLLAFEPDGVLVGALAATSIEESTELETLLVLPAMRRRGIARLLSRMWLRRAAGLKAETAYLEVRESNAGARCLYEQMGFRADGRRPAYYRNPTEDAILMRKVLNT